MQSTADTNNIAVNIAENISILHLLHEVPGLPTSNPVPSPISNDPTEYSLSFKKERDLTIMLAYISCIKDNPNRVPAVCIKEDKAADRLDILVAVNASNGANKGALSDIRKNFEGLFKLLSSASTSDNAEQNIFNKIVSVCYTRILERLRLVSPKDRRKDKQPIDKLISKSIEILEQESRAFAKAAKDWETKIKRWKNHQTPSELTRVVESAYNLSRLPDLESLLERISNDKMAPDSRKRLLNAIKKVARYRNAARVLYRAAKKFPIAQRMNFIPVNLPEVAFTKVPETMQAPGRGISEALSRTPLSKREHKQMNLCYDYLKTDHEEADKRFKEQKIQILDEAKIHAEVQLVFFCEANNFKAPPRVISSSKDACFLCNALINVHGKYHIPRQHRRLYPGWRLPWFPAPNSIQSRFAKHLEDVISGSIRTMIQSQKRINYPPPNESTALTVALSETTASVNGSYPSTSSRISSPAKAEVQQPVPLHDSGEVGTSAVRLPTPGSPSRSIANAEKAQDDMASESQEVIYQEEKGERGNAALSGKPEEVVDQGEHGEKGDSVLSGKPEEVANRGEKGNLVLCRKSPEARDERGEEAKTAIPPRKPPKVPPRPPPKQPPRVFSERWAKLSKPIPNRLIQGTPQVVNVEANTSSRFYKGNSVGLEIEYCTTGPAEKRVARDLSCKLKWLDTADAEAVRADGDALIINVEKLEDEIPISSSAFSKWYIATKEVIIRVQIQ